MWLWKTKHDNQDSSVFFGLQVVHAKLLGVFGVSHDLMLTPSLLRMTFWLLRASNVMPHGHRQTEETVVYLFWWRTPDTYLSLHWGRQPAETLVLIVLYASPQKNKDPECERCRYIFVLSSLVCLCSVIKNRLLDLNHPQTNKCSHSVDSGCLYSVKPLVCNSYGWPVEGSVHCW